LNYSVVSVSCFPKSGAAMPLGNSMIYPKSKLPIVPHCLTVVCWNDFFGLANDWPSHCFGIVNIVLLQNTVYIRIV
jgi:hypothetical protein